MGAAGFAGTAVAGGFAGGRAWAKAGGASSRAAVAAKIVLTSQQQSQVAELLREREDRLAKVGKDQAHVIRSDVDKQVLREAWQAGRTAGGPAPVSATKTAPRKYHRFRAA